MKKLIPALALLVVSAILMGTSTFAWFSLNSKVSVTGMQVHTEVKENLRIADDTLGSTERKADSLFSNALVQQYDKLLEPVSTVDGENFFYTAGTNVKGDGDALNETYTAYAEGDAFDQAYGVNTTPSSADAFGYVDYVFQLQATNGATASQIRLTKLKLTYGGTTANDNTAFRVAMFAENIGYKTAADTSHLGNPTGGVGTLTTIFTPAAAVNFTAGKAVNSTSTLDTVTYCAANTTAVLPVAANTTQYYKVVIRLWIEGEDKTCNNLTFMDLKDKWMLDLEFDLKAAGAAADAVVNIEQANTAAKTTLTIGTDDGVDDATKIIVNGVTYYKITGKTLNTQQLYVASNATLAAASHIFIMTNNNLNPVEVTNQVSIVTPGP